VPGRPARRLIGFLGGTGPQGRGLGLRLAAAGHRVLLGSRDPERASAVLKELRSPVGALVGVGNREACEAEVVFVTVPYAAQRDTLAPLGDALDDKIVVTCVNALAFDERGPRPVRVEAGSAAEECALLLPRARIVSAFHDVSARRLLHLDEPVGIDVLMCGDDEDAKAEVALLAADIPGMRAVDAGPLRLSAPIEDLTAVLMSVNRRYSIHAGICVDGLAR
jgi:NADPH-dependent F420 reductase